MYKFKRFLKKLFTPVTVMLIPHDSKQTINLKLPSIGLIASVFLWCVGSIYVVSIAIETLDYYRLKKQVNYFNEQFTELKTAISTVRKAESDFKKILSFGSKEKILENVDVKNNSDAGSLDMDLLKEQIRNTVDKVADIKTYLKDQKDLYMATPKGWPVNGRITSGFGKRESPMGSGSEFHSALDIAAQTGTPVRVTADGIVSFSGKNRGSGNVVVIEHGFGYSSLYAHNSTNTVEIGQKVKRGDIIAYVGSTGNTTGPHLHYEIWINEKPVNPEKFLK